VKIDSPTFLTETTFISASVQFSSGSQKFGDTTDDQHQFTGSVFIKGQAGGVGESLVLGSYGDGATQLMIRSNGSSNPNIRIERGSSGNNFSIQNNGALNILRNTTALMTFKYTGEVGINETNPSEKLHVGGNIFATGNISGSSTSTGSFGQLRIVDDIVSTDTVLNYISDNYHVFYDSGDLTTPAVSIVGNNKRLGIGVLNPSNALEVVSGGKTIGMNNETIVEYSYNDTSIK